MALTAYFTEKRHPFIHSFKKGSGAEKTSAAGFTSKLESKQMKDRSVMTRFVTKMTSPEQLRVCHIKTDEGQTSHDKICDTNELT